MGRLKDTVTNLSLSERQRIISERFEQPKQEGLLGTIGRKVGDFFKPAEPKKLTPFQKRLQEAGAGPKTPTEVPIRLRDVVREFPKATTQVATGIGGFLKMVQEEIARSGASTAISTTGLGVRAIAPVVSKLTGEPVEQIRQRGVDLAPKTIDPSDTVSKLIFGDRPLESLEFRIARGELNVQDFARSLQRGTIDVPVATPEQARGLGAFLEKQSLPLSIIGIGAMVALDFTGTGGGAKGAAKILSKTNNVGEVIAFGKRMGIADDLVEPWAKQVAKMADEKEIEQSIKNIDAIQRTTKVVQDVVSGVSKTTQAPAPRISPDLQPLAQEARKYKSAEEFVNSKISTKFDNSDEVTGRELFHATPKENLPSIIKNGLTQGNATRFGESSRGGLYFSSSIRKAAEFVEEPPVYLRVKNGDITLTEKLKGKLELDPFDTSGQSIKTNKNIPVEDLEIKTKEGWKPLSQLIEEFKAQKAKGGIEAENIFLEKNAGKKIDGVTIPKDFKAYRRTITGETVDVNRLKTDSAYFKQAYESTFARGHGTDELLYKKMTKALVPEGKEASGTLADLYNKAKETPPKSISEQIVKPKVRQMKTSAEIPSLKTTAKEQMQKESQSVAKTQTDAGNTNVQKSSEYVESYKNDTMQETKVNRQATAEIVKKDPTKTAGEVGSVAKEPDLITTRKFKQTDEWKDFAKYAEDNLQDKDINPALLHRHTTMTAERVAEFLDGGIGGRTYRTIVKPVYDSAEKMQLEGFKIKQEVESFRVLEGTTIDRDASLFAQKKLDDAPQKSKDIAKYTRDKYDEFLERLNATRAKVGVEPIPKRKDYVTHLNELNVLSELFGGYERITVKRRISELKSELLDTHPDWTEARAFDAAKREVEGLTGVAQYVDARQPIFRFAKKRLGEYEANPSIIRSFGAYTQNALQYIYQAENVAKNKAFKDVLPANSREFMRLWNTEQVAGRQAPSFLSPVARRALSAIRGTLGANTILGNMATTMMQLTSWPQVVALAGVKNTFYGLGSRLRTYIPGLTNQFDVSRTKHLRNLNIDIGLGDSLIDKALVSMGSVEILRNPAARTRQAVDVGRNFLMAIMETADQFTVGATYQAFYRKGVLDGLSPQKAMEFADIMTGKTQANYFKEALPPFLNTVEGKTLGQFGTYGMNQWEMFKRDFGKDFKLDEKNPKSVARFFKQFMVFLTSAYIIDSMSEETFGRQPFGVKELVDDSVGFAKGELTGGQLFDTAKDTVASYIPFMGSVKFNSMPPVLEFGKDVIGATIGTGKKQEEAIANLQEKWVYNILLPYAGNQARKSAQGAEAISDVDLPFVRNVSKDIDIETNIDKAKAILFGPYATEEARKYFENRDRRDAIKDKYKITGTITSDENITLLKKMTDEEFEIYTAGYADSTKKTIARAKAQEPIRKIYDQAKQLVKDGKKDEAQAIVDDLTDKEYDIYKKLKADDSKKETQELQKEMFSVVKSNQKLLVEGKRDEAQDVVDALSDEEYKAYQNAKKSLLVKI